MKYIFDFDDVIFDSHTFKNRIAELLLGYSISREDFLADYAQVRGPGYSVSQHITDLFQKYNVQVGESEITSIVDTLFADIKQLLNFDVVTFISKNTSDVFILSAGNTDFQMRKIIETGIKDIVSEVVIVPHSKKEWVIVFAKKYPDETVYFIDDNREHLLHKEFDSVSNLKTILYTGKECLKSIV